MIRRFLITLFLSAACLAQAAEADSTRRSVPNRIVSVGSGLAINAGVTEILKHSIHKVRPDGSDNHSFPSRHTSWAFAASTAIALELGDRSPWWGTGAYAAASMVGFQRVYKEHHYTSDVMSGAGIGILSAEIGHLIGNAIFGQKDRWGAENDFRTSFSYVSGQIWTLKNFDYFGNPSLFCTGIRGVFRVRGNWGISAHLFTMTPLCYEHILQSFGLTVGCVYHQRITRSLAVQPELAVGCSYLRFACSPGVALDYRLTKRWSASLRVGYTNAPVSSITASVASAVVF